MPVPDPFNRDPSLGSYYTQPEDPQDLSSDPESHIPDAESDHPLEWLKQRLAPLPPDIISVKGVSSDVPSRRRRKKVINKADIKIAHCPVSAVTEPDLVPTLACKEEQLDTRSRWGLPQIAEEDESRRRTSEDRKHPSHTRMNCESSPEITRSPLKRSIKSTFHWH
ncbi:hypothetical protein FB451DRAFT_1181004 [Mycena latifolia]|nr:hypothetical protein FB451DRAFT_1181004 [Mycena latifolia]